MRSIGTHDGTFHCDEALACYMLRQLDGFKDGKLVRSRDENVLKDLDCVVDVGGVYDTKTLRFDHHQRGFFETFDEKRTTKLSSAGLVYKHMGREVIQSILGKNLPEDDMEKVYVKVSNCCTSIITHERTYQVSHRNTPNSQGSFNFFSCFGLYSL